MNDAVLLATARHAYERGRVKKGLRQALFVLPVALLPLYPCMAAGRGMLMLLLLATLGALLVLCHWRGQDYARGANIGLIAGLSPLLLPVVTSWISPVCSTIICGFLPAASVAGGFFGALSLAGAGLLGERPSPGFWLAAISVTVTLGAAGCLHVGLAGLAGLALGLAVGALPVLALYVARAR
ncbi:MAG TPA: hypothetical protein VF432_22965 [Thermoanaerobaculia bacterium]